jgi:hypothetical protein
MKIKSIFIFLLICFLLKIYASTVNFYIKNDQFHFAQISKSICEDTKLLDSLINNEYKNGRYVNIVTDSLSFYSDFWRSIAAISKYADSTIYIKKANTTYKIYKYIERDYDSTYLYHLITADDKYIFEGFRNRWGYRYSKSDTDNNILSRFIDSIISTNNKYKLALDSKYISFSFNGNEHISWVFKIMDCLLRRNISHFYFLKLNVKPVNIPLDHCGSIFDSSYLSLTRQESEMLSRPKDSIMKIVNSNLVELKMLYNKWLKLHKNAKGKITVKFLINEKGYVVNSEIIEDSFIEKGFALEVLNQIKKWQFGAINKPKDLAGAIYPFIFNP